MKLKIKIFILVLCVCDPSYAEFDHDALDIPLVVSKDISLYEVIEKTYQRNPNIQVMQARLKNVGAQLAGTKRLWVDDPSFSVSHYNDELMGRDGLMEWEVGIAMQLWLPGQKQARRDTFQQRKLLINASGPALKLKLAGVVREILWNIALTKSQLTIAEKEWEVVKKLEKDVKKRVELGDLSIYDLNLAQQESLFKEAALQKIRQEYGHAQHRYTMITDLKVLPAIFEETATEDLSITENHPDLYEARKQVSSSFLLREQVKLEKRGSPSLFVGTRHERSTSKAEFENAIGLNFSIPLGLSAYTLPKITAAEVHLSESQSNMELLYRELNIVIQDASKDLDGARKQFEFSVRQNTLAKKNLELSRKAFLLGETSLIEFIRIQAQAFSVERNMHQKQLEVGLYTARLNQAKGIIP